MGEGGGGGGSTKEEYQVLTEEGGTETPVLSATGGYSDLHVTVEATESRPRSQSW